MLSVCRGHDYHAKCYRAGCDRKDHEGHQNIHTDALWWNVSKRQKLTVKDGIYWQWTGFRGEVKSTFWKSDFCYYSTCLHFDSFYIEEFFFWSLYAQWSSYYRCEAYSPLREGTFSLSRQNGNFKFQNSSCGAKKYFMTKAPPRKLPTHSVIDFSFCSYFLNCLAWDNSVAAFRLLN